MTDHPLDPPLECDLVMKGGITSGVIYPRAVCELARTYRLRSVGGASAGAIAAAAAAAAELGRATGGFELLEGLPEDITAPSPAGGSTLFRLFQPGRATAPLYRALTAGMGHTGLARKLRMAGGVLRGFWAWGLAGAAPGAVILVASLSGAGIARGAGTVAGVLLVLLGAVAGIAGGMFTVLGRLPALGFGLCDGMPGDGGRDAQSLTPWLHDRLQSMAGRSVEDPPVTFGDLARAGIELRTMTTNLTRHQPMAMPWRSGEYFFDPAGMRELFPEDVVQWMEDHPPSLEGAPSDIWELELLRQQALPLRPFPGPADVPIVVATRMSLSFPVLISAVPLFAVDRSLPANSAARRAASDWRRAHPEGTPAEAAREVPALALDPNWFSDGGICANLPVHFFDHPLPSRPTFAIDLASFPVGRSKDADECRNSTLPTSNAAGLLRRWVTIPAHGVGGLAAFLLQVVETARGWVDAAQLTMPGYRDRVVTIWHDDEEGGMNLAMPPETVAGLAERGRCAAERLSDRFAGDAPGVLPSPGWENHRWIRFRTSTAGLTTWLGLFADGYAAPSAGATPYSSLAGPGADAALPSYPLTVERRRRVNAHTGDLLGLATEWASDDAMTAGAPRPRPQLRLVPDDGTAVGLAD
ncbi:MAG: hypothetical protein ACQERF_00555 [Actinomycetota bacterium]